MQKGAPTIGGARDSFARQGNRDVECISLPCGGYPRMRWKAEGIQEAVEGGLGGYRIL